MRRPLCFCLLLLALPACQDARPTSEAPVVLYAGSRYDWEELSHRVAYLRAATNAPDGDSFTADLGIIGGNFSTGGVDSDVPTWSLAWMAVDSPHVAVIEGSAELLIDGSGAASVQVEVPLPEADWPDVTVALRGVTFDTDEPLADDAPGDYDPSHGWTPQRLGAGVGPLTVDGGTGRFEAWMRFDAEPANETDRPTMSANTEFARVAGLVHYSVVLSAGERASGTLVADQYILRDPPYTEVVPLPAEDRTLRVDAAPDGSLAIPLLRSWDMNLNQTIGREGRYLRSFGVMLEEQTYAAETGTATLRYDLFCSHSSLVEEGDLQVQFEVEAEVLVLPDSSGAATLRSASEASDVGPIQRVLPR